MLLRAFNHVEHRDKTMRVPMISSLLSQPIVEYCLGIPPWEACEGGVDRSVARRAFAQDLPIAVTARSGKGSPDGFVGHYIDTHRSEEHTSELQSLMRISYAVFCLKKKINTK